jgi:hypothetical protein
VVLKAVPLYVLVIVPDRVRAPVAPEVRVDPDNKNVPTPVVLIDIEVNVAKAFVIEDPTVAVLEDD